MADRASYGSAQGQFHDGDNDSRHSSTTVWADAVIMRNRFFLFSFALVGFTVAILLFEAHAGTVVTAPEHCGFWTTIDAGLSCR